MGAGNVSSCSPCKFTFQAAKKPSTSRATGRANALDAGSAKQAVPIIAGGMRECRKQEKVELFRRKGSSQ
jgi:hypothetical protein